MVGILLVPFDGYPRKKTSYPFLLQWGLKQMESGDSLDPPPLLLDARAFGFRCGFPLKATETSNSKKRDPSFFRFTRGEDQFSARSDRYILPLHPFTALRCNGGSGTVVVCGGNIAEKSYLPRRPEI